MAQTKHDIQALLAQAGSEPRHRFGQNFMIDQNLVRVVAEAGQIEAGDLVIEVGPGTGTLTEELLSRVGAGGGVLAVEIDRDLAELMRGRFGGEGGGEAGGAGDAASAGRGEKFRLIEGDALAGKHSLNAELAEAVREARATGRGVKLVANLPYNIASPLVVDLLVAGVELLAFTVQKEVAQRLRAAAGSEAYGPLSVMAQLLARVEVLRTLPPQAFWPAPRIESALVRMVREDRLGGRTRAFGAFVAKLFSARRKTLRKALSQAGYPAEALLARRGVEGQRRPEELGPEELLGLFEAAAGEVGAGDGGTGDGSFA